MALYIRHEVTRNDCWDQHTTTTNAMSPFCSSGRCCRKNWRVSPVNFRGHFGCSMQKEPGIEVQCSLWSTPSRPNSKTCFHYSRANRSNHQSSVLSFVPSFTNILEVTTLQKCRAILGSFEFVFWWIFLNFFFGRGAPKGGGCGWHIWWGYVSNYIMISFGGRK